LDQKDSSSSFHYFITCHLPFIINLIIELLLVQKRSHFILYFLYLNQDIFNSDYLNDNYSTSKDSCIAYFNSHLFKLNFKKHLKTFTSGTFVH
jgi:hypothetical protein